MGIPISPHLAYGDNMADNSYFRMKGVRSDVRSIAGNYTIKPHIDECIRLLSAGKGDDTILLPEAIPGRSYEVILVDGTFTLEATRGDVILYNGEENESLTALDKGVSLNVHCKKYGEWIAENVIGFIIESSVIDKVYTDENGYLYTDELGNVYITE